MRYLATLIVVLALTSVAQARDLTLPDPSITTGAVRPGMTKAVICRTKWGKDARHVSSAMKSEVFQAYGLTGNDDAACVADKNGRRCEIDHLISRELGGADEVKNLWPEPYGTTPWNAARKDRVENRLHKEVCAGHISLAAARREIKIDWRVPYRRYFGEP